jgi:site-specific DNA-methyltransferase (adenine-specific)
VIDLSLRWQVIHGDCLDVMRQLPDGCVDAVVTDPPYNAINRTTGGLRSLDKGVADSAPIDIPALAAEFWRIGRESFYVWCSDEQYTDWVMAFKGMGATTRICAWWKTNPSPMNGENLWLSAVELCVFARKPKATFNLHCAHPVWREPTEQGDIGHPTPKPVDLMRRQLLASMPSGGIVLDPFAGSGSTGVAAVQENYRFIGIEREASYVDIARRRIADAAAQGNLFQEAQ